MPLDETTINGQAGHLADHNALHAHLNRLYPLSNYGTVVYNSSAAGAANLAVINLALAAAAVTGGSVVFDGAGDLYVSGQITIPTAPAGKPEAGIEGPGMGVLRLRPTADFGTGFAMIAPTDPAASATIRGSYIRDLELLGPGVAAPALGSTPANMYGVRVRTGWLVERVKSTRFHSGFEIDGNHEVLRDCTANKNKYGLYRVSAGAPGGDVIDNCEFDSNTLAAVAVNNAGIWDNLLMTNTRVGVRRMGFYRESGGLTVTWMLKCYLERSDAEFVGNALIFDASANGKLQFCTIDVSVSYGPSNLLGGALSEVLIDVGSVDDVTLEGANSINQMGATPLGYVRTSGACAGFWWRRMKAAQRALGSATFSPLIVGGTLTNSGYDDGRVRGIFARAGALLVIDRLVAYTGESAVSTASATATIGSAGVTERAVASGSIGCIQTQGPYATLDSVGALTAGRIVVHEILDPGKVKLFAGGTETRVGIATAATAAGKTAVALGI